MRKIISLTLALLLILSLATVAFAAEIDNVNGSDASVAGHTVTIKKQYTSNGETAKSPAETFDMSITSGTVENGGEVDGEVVTTSPAATISDVTYNEADSARTKEITVTLPAYEAVGVYSYTITEAAPASATAGVEYYTSNITLKVTVVQAENDKLAYAAVYAQSEDGSKSDTFENTYTAGSLKVSKVLSGNFVDTEKKFDITASFTSTKEVKAPIYAEDGTTVMVAVSDWTKSGETWTASKTVQLTGGEDAYFTNIPNTVTYNVTEADYSGEGYTTEITFGDTAKAITATEEDTVTVTNTKNTQIDTGITMDSVPYVLLIAVCALACVMFVIKRRPVEF